MYRIHVRKILEDVKTGVPERELVKKYGLSSKRLKLLVEVIAKRDSRLHEALYSQFGIYRRTADYLSSRRFDRLRVPIAIRVYDKLFSQQGFLRDISENGIRVAGMSTQVGQSAILFLPLDEMGDLNPLEFKAVCRWSKEKGTHSKCTVSGFEVTDMTGSLRSRFLGLIEFLRFQDEGEDWTSGTGLSGTELLLSVSDTRPLGAAREFSGEIHNVDILDFVQLLILTSARIEVDVHSSRGETGRLFLRAGNVIHAVQGNLVGREAFFACMNFPGGKFSTQPLDDLPEMSIEEPGHFLLIEAARMRDELSTESKSGPDEDWALEDQEGWRA
jgi:hypothetical protein